MLQNSQLIYIISKKIKFIELLKLVKKTSKIKILVNCLLEEFSVRIILASNSRPRKKIFDILGFKYEIITSKCEEHSDQTDFSKYVMELSKTKANSVKEQLNGEKALIIAADTIAAMGDKKFEKPKSKQEAFENMMAFSSKVNEAFTGVTIIDLYQSKEVTFFDKAEIHLRNIDENDARWYVENDKNILERAGYSMCDGLACVFVDKIIGDFYTIAGMPVGKLFENLKALGYEMKDLIN